MLMWNQGWPPCASELSEMSWELPLTRTWYPMPWQCCLFKAWTAALHLAPQAQGNLNTWQDNTLEIHLHVELLLQNTHWTLAEDVRPPKRCPQATYTQRRVQIQGWNPGAVRTKKRKWNLSQQPQTTWALFYFILSSCFLSFYFFSLLFWAEWMKGSWCSSQASGLCFWGGRANFKTLVHKRPPSST